MRSNKKLTIEEMRKLAESKNGKCLSDVYVNDSTPLVWQCNKKHKPWKAAPNNIKFKSWCPQCYGERKIKHTIEEMREIAAKHGGKCLSEKYKSTKKRLWWQCKEGHKWKCLANVVIRGSWCRKCVDAEQRFSSEYLNKLAEEHGGKYLPQTYKNSIEDLWWECSFGHRWKSPVYRVKRGCWCPFCHNKTHLNQERCRYIFEWFTKNTFFLDRKVLGGLELDGYCEKLELAFEYNGLQHFEYVEFFHRTEKRFNEIKRHDLEKIRLCKEKNITLIVVPFNISVKEMVVFIYNKLKENRVAIAGNPSEFPITDLWTTDFYARRYNNFVRSNNGELVDIKIGTRKETRLVIKCSEGHTIERTSSQIKGSKKLYCQICRKNRELD